MSVPDMPPDCALPTPLTDTLPSPRLCLPDLTYLQTKEHSPMLFEDLETGIKRMLAHWLFATPKLKQAWVHGRFSLGDR